jgi:hypothetical protein
MKDPIKLSDGRTVDFLSAQFNPASQDFQIKFVDQGELDDGRVSSADYWWQILKSDTYSQDEDFDSEAMLSLIAEFDSSTEYYEDDYRYLPRQKKIPTKIMDQLLDNFLAALESGEYFDGGSNDGAAYVIEILASPSLSKKQARRIYQAIFEGSDESDPLENIIAEYDEGSLLVSVEDFLRYVRAINE